MICGRVFYIPGPWDDTLKMFISENPQDFASWLFGGAQVTWKLRTEFKKRTIDADALLEVIRDGEMNWSYAPMATAEPV